MASVDERVEELVPEERGRPVTCDVYTSVQGGSADIVHWYNLHKLCDTLSIDEKIQRGKTGVIKLAVSVLKSGCGETLHASVCFALSGLFIGVQDNRTLAYSNGIEDALMLVNGLHPHSTLVFDALVKLMDSMPELVKGHTLWSLKIRSTQMNEALGTHVTPEDFEYLLIRGRANISLNVDVARHDAIICKSIGDMIISENMFASGHQYELACWFHEEGLMHDMLALRPWINKEAGLKLSVTHIVGLVNSGIKHFYRDCGCDAGKFYLLLGKLLVDAENALPVDVRHATKKRYLDSVVELRKYLSDVQEGMHGDVSCEEIQELLLDLQDKNRTTESVFREIEHTTSYKICWWLFRESYFQMCSAGTLELARCYFNGTGVLKNIGTGFNLLSKAYWQGNTDASAICGALMWRTYAQNSFSPDITADYRTAFELITLAVESGYDGHWFPNFKNILNCDPGVSAFEKFVTFLISTADDNAGKWRARARKSAVGQLLNISKCYETGVDGLVRNLKKAVFFTKAATSYDPRLALQRLNHLRKCSCCGQNDGDTFYCRCCYTVRYCDRECQKMEWARCHKTDCQAFRPHINVPGGLLN